MQDEVTFANTTLPLFFYELIDDVRGDSPNLPKFKGIGENDLTKMLPKDRRLAALVLLYEIASKLDAVDKHVHEPGQRFTDPYIENAISQFSATTGLPEDDIRRILRRPRLPTASDLGPEPPAAETTNPQWRDP